jgi:hypothetical protein
LENKKELDIFLILSIKKGSGTLFGRLLGIGKNGVITYGIFDNSLLGIINAGPIVECYAIISDGDGYITLYETDYVVTINNDPSFPSGLNRRYIADIKQSIRTEHIDDPFTLYIIEAEMVGGITITVRDDKICEQLHDGDKIRIMGAYINTCTSSYEDGWVVTEVELRLSPYGSIAITEPYITYDPYYDKPFT